MPSTVSWPEMDGPTAHPTGATLALGDPPKSLNAPEGAFKCPWGGLGYHLVRGALGFAPWLGLWRFPAIVAAACIAIGYGQGSDRQSGPPRRRGSTAEAFYLTAAFARKSMDPLLHSQNMEDGLCYMGVAVPLPRVVAVWPRG